MAEPPNDILEHEIAAATPTLKVKAAGGALGAAGFTTAAVAIQVLAVFSLRGWIFALVLALLVGGVGGLGVAPFLMRARDWAAGTGLFFAILLVVLDLAWIVVSFAHLVFFAMPLLALGTAVLACVLVPLAMHDCQTASDARRRMRAAGLDLGI